jgi:pSer/pThr/pTyr-binding forkhead associated (FHA) protein
MKILLELRSGPNAGSKLPLAPGQALRIGRHPKADHPFPDDKLMSGLHFAIDYGEKGCRLLDLQSSNGTFLNGARVKEATLASGDEIRAGNTVFVIRMLPDEALPAESRKPEPLPTPRPKPKPVQTPASPAPAPGMYGGLPSFPAAAPKIVTEPVALPHARPLSSPPTPRQPRLQDLLAKDFQPLYALLDASREPSVLKVILESKEEYQSLYEGPQGAQLAHFAPYLVRVPQKSALLDTLVQQAWSKSWGVFVTCDMAFKDLRTHFRHFLTVKLPDGQQVYFRYYDPRVLRLFLPTCLPEETTEFFGPVKHFLMEAEDPKLALHFSRGPKGPDKKELHLAPA